MTTILWREHIANVVLATAYLYFFSNNFAYLTTEFRISVLILAIFNLVIAFNAIFRRVPTRVSLKLFDVCITLIGTYSLTFAVGVRTQEEVIALQLLGGAGLMLSLLGLLTLNKSFGLLPADRGVVTGGIYSVLRHPIYAGYFLSSSCFLAQNYSLHNLVCFMLFAVCETLRLHREEKLLLQNPHYAEYASKVRWRILPFVW